MLTFSQRSSQQTYIFKDQLQAVHKTAFAQNESKSTYNNKCIVGCKMNTDIRTGGHSAKAMKSRCR